MPKYRLTNEALSDLADIWNYTADESSEAQADSYYELIMAAFERIAEHPNWYGKKYDEIFKGLFGFKVRKHIIFYIIDSEGNILVVRILHERMDLKNHF